MESPWGRLGSHGAGGRVGVVGGQGMMLWCCAGAQWIGVPGELRGYAEAHRRHGRLAWAQLFQPTIALLRGGYRLPPVLGQFLNHSLLRPSLNASSLR